MAGMQPPNVPAMGSVPQQHPQGMPGQQAPQVQVQQQAGAQQQQQQPQQQQQQAAHTHQPQPQPQSQPQTQQHPDQHDTIIKQVKTTMALLKESLRNLMRIASQAFTQSAAIDNTSKAPDEIAARFDKSMEEFCSLCDQLELNLRLAHDCTTQYMDGARYTPVPLQQHHHKPDLTPTEGLTSGQYISTVRAQIQCASEVHTALLDLCQKLGHAGQT